MLKLVCACLRHTLLGGKVLGSKLDLVIGRGRALVDR